MPAWRKGIPCDVSTMARASLGNNAQRLTRSLFDLNQMVAGIEKIYEHLLPETALQRGKICPIDRYGDQVGRESAKEEALG